MKTKDKQKMVGYWVERTGECSWAVMSDIGMFGVYHYIEEAEEIAEMMEQGEIE